MAVAHVAFLAAQAGHRVLVMDWDLEAPGLAYYFRALSEPGMAREIREAPGVLNLLWDWNHAIDACNTESEFEKVQQRYLDGQAFAELTRPVLSPAQLPNGGCLHIITAGTAVKNLEQVTPYEQALAQFSWPEFFDAKAGGYALNCLRDWAKQHYDVILLDSRTGLADVAGLCTMLLPDAVALCFILNRQNVDGVAQIANAIHTRRGKEIQIRAVPMRLARNGNSAESDACARAMNDLVHSGAFTNQEIENDFEHNAIPIAENVPFQECLSLFTAPDSELDPQTLNYARLARQLVHVDINIPKLGKTWIEQVRSRLQPKIATIEYLQRLKTAEPARAASDLQRLLQGAMLALGDAIRLHDDYILALCESAGITAQSLGLSEQAGTLIEMSLELLRALASQQPQPWRRTLIDRLSAVLEFPVQFSEAQILAMQAELDEHLAAEPSVDNQLKRIEFRSQRARNDLMSGQIQAATWLIESMSELITQLKNTQLELSSAQIRQFFWYQVDLYLLRGDLQNALLDTQQANAEYQNGLVLLDDRIANDDRELYADLGTELNLKYAHTSSSDRESRFRHIMAAMSWGDLAAIFDSIEFINQTVLAASKDDPASLLDFCTLFARCAQDFDARRALYLRGLDSAQITENLVKLCIALAESRESGAHGVLAELVVPIARIIEAISLQSYVAHSSRNDQMLLILARFIDVLKSADLTQLVAPYLQTLTRKFEQLQYSGLDPQRME